MTTELSHNAREKIDTRIPADDEIPIFSQDANGQWYWAFSGDPENSKPQGPYPTRILAVTLLCNYLDRIAWAAKHLRLGPTRSQ